MEKFKELISKCKASITIDINDHKSCYESVEDYIDGFEGDREEIEDSVFNEMVRSDTVIRIQVYPRTPISFFVIYHYDIDKAIEMALNSIQK